MAKYLIHQGRNAYPFGIFRFADDYFYGYDSTHKMPYGLAVVGAMGYAITWDDWIERLASKIPGPTDQWDIVESDADAQLEDVLDDARASLTYGD